MKRKKQYGAGGFLAFNTEYFDLTGTATLENILTPLRASINATSWGVDTIKAPGTKKKDDIIKREHEYM